MRLSWWSLPRSFLSPLSPFTITASLSISLCSEQPVSQLTLAWRNVCLSLPEFLLSWIHLFASFSIRVNCAVFPALPHFPLRWLAVHFYHHFSISCSLNQFVPLVSHHSAIDFFQDHMLRLLSGGCVNWNLHPVDDTIDFCLAESLDSPALTFPRFLILSCKKSHQRFFPSMFYFELCFYWIAIWLKPLQHFCRSSGECFIC